MFKHIMKIKHKHLNKIMDKMCSYVGVKFKDIDPKKPNWFLKYSWTLEQEDDFRKYFIKYLMDSAEARKEIMETPIKNKKVISGLVEFFILVYGWKVK